MATHHPLPPRTGLVDPSRPAEYPILLGDKLAGKDSSNSNQFIGVRYNHKPKNDSARYKNVIRPISSSSDQFSLTLEDTVTPPDQNPITYKYRGSLDPKSTAKDVNPSTLALVFDPNQKAFILEPVSTELNFNLVASPGKTDQQLLQNYEQLAILGDEASARRTNGRVGDKGSASDDDFSAPDDDNPYDYRHFIQKEKDEPAATPRTGFEPSPSPNLYSTRTLTPITATTKPRAKAPPKPKTASSRAVAAKSRAKPRTKSAEKVAGDSDKDSSVDEQLPPPPQPTRRKSKEVAASPNIQVDGDLIIDMGSPPPQTAKRKINIQHFASSSNNTSANEADDDEEEEERSEEDGDIEHLRLPSPAPQVKVTPSAPVDDDDDDGLAAEMEAALEESANEEEARMQQHISQPLEDESEESEEE